MSRIGDALKRAGAPDITSGLQELPLQEGASLPVSEHAPRSAARAERLERAAAAAEKPEAAAPAKVNGTGGSDGPLRPDERLVLNAELPALAVEQYRRLAATLHHVQEDRGVKRVIVTSAVANEGKTLTSTNLALTLSQSYARRVLLIDADLRRPRVNAVFGLPSGPGLSEALDRRDPGKLPLAQVSSTLSVLPAGRATSDPMAALTSSRMAAILQEASEQFDWVIIDTPPVGLLSDARLVASMADLALVVIGASTTPAAAVQRAIDAVGRERVLGVVLNRADEKLAAGGHYHYYYYGYYGNGSKGDGKTGWLRKLLRRK